MRLWKLFVVTGGKQEYNSALELLPIAKKVPGPFKRHECQFSVFAPTPAATRYTVYLGANVSQLLQIWLENSGCHGDAELKEGVNYLSCRIFPLSSKSSQSASLGRHTSEALFHEITRSLSRLNQRHKTQHYIIKALYAFGGALRNARSGCHTSRNTHTSTSVTTYFQTWIGDLV